MSAEFFNKLKHLQMRYDALQKAYDELAERVLALEADPVEWPELAVDSLKISGDSPTATSPKRRGRPPKVKHEE